MNWLSHYIIVLNNKKMKRIDRLEVKSILCLVIFLFVQSRNNAVLEPTTGCFRGLVDFEAKDFKMYPRGQERP